MICDDVSWLDVASFSCTLALSYQFNEQAQSIKAS
jgi:hypothetical protein